MTFGLLRALSGFALAAAALAQTSSPLPGMPPVLNPADIYAADHAGEVAAAVRNFPALVYVPNSKGDSVDVIDQKTFKIVGHFPSGGKEPQHVVPQYDMKRLWVINDLGDSATDIDPATGSAERRFRWKIRTT